MRNNEIKILELENELQKLTNQLQNKEETIKHYEENRVIEKLSAEGQKSM